MLCFSGAVRNGAGLVWAYNILLFFDEYWPDVRVSESGEVTSTCSHVSPITVAFHAQA